MFTKRIDKEERLRRKLVHNELNPIADFLLTCVVFCLTPLMWVISHVQDKVMFNFLGKSYIYNVSWEDPRMDHRVMNLSEDDHVLTIASAGCNVLDYLIEGASVTAVDFNACQIALTELKMIAIIILKYDEFFAIFGENDSDLFRRLYCEKLRANLSPSSKEFWDSKIDSFKSFMYSGTSGKMAYLLFRVIFPLFGLGFIRKELVKGVMTKDQLQKTVANNSYSIRCLAWLLDNILVRGGSAFAGVPEKQLALGLHRPNNLATVMEKVLFRSDLINDNYFFAGYILGYYTVDNCPRYLKPENFQTMKKNLQKGKLKLVHGTILDAIARSDKPFTVASLLDHMDWMPDRLINEELAHLVKKMDSVNGRIFWRTFADEVHAAPLQWLQPQRVDDSDDRVPMYFSTWIAHLKDSSVSYEQRVDTFQSKGTIANLITGAKMVTFPFWKPFVASTLSATGHAKDMEAFYKYQKNDYDTFREGLLHGRPALMEAFPLLKQGNMVWLDVGGGTARNLEYFTPQLIRKYFKKIVIVDVSTSLLEMAQKRVASMGLENIVTVLEHDFTAETVFGSLPGMCNVGKVDMITMSYSFTMIPDKAAAMRNIGKLLKKGGICAMTDFFSEGKFDECLSPLFYMFRRIEGELHKRWFAMDRVFLLGEEQLQLAPPELEVVWDNRFRGAIPFLPFFQPFHGVYIMKKVQI